MCLLLGLQNLWLRVLLRANEKQCGATHVHVAARSRLLHKVAQFRTPRDDFLEQVILCYCCAMSDASAHVLRVGPAGWQYPDWGGIVYPAKRPRDFDALQYIASYFNLVEINSTFYRLPAPATSRSWAERVAAYSDFVFTLKTHHTFTHAASAPNARDVTVFQKTVAPLLESGRLASVLVQYPWSFKYSDTTLDRVRQTVQRLSPFPVAVELRHGSWEDRDALQAINDAGATVCAIDQPIIGQSIRPQWNLPGPAGAYVRFHGRNYGEWFRKEGDRDTRYDYLYSEEELRPWVDMIRRTLSKNTPTVAVLNNHFRGQAPVNAFMLMSLLGEKPVPAPPSLRNAYAALEKHTTAVPYAAAWESDSLFGRESSAGENQDH